MNLAVQSSTARTFKAHRVAFVFWGVLVLGFLARLYLSQFFTYSGDFEIWKQWASGLEEKGLAEFYETQWSDYLPGYLYVLWGLQKLSYAAPYIPEEILFKLPANIADVLIVMVIYAALRRIAGRGKAAFAALLYFFNPASLANSTFWGQADAVHAVTLLAAVAAASRGSFLVSGIAGAAAFMVKPQSIVAAPILLFWSVRALFRPGGLRNIAQRRFFRPLFLFLGGTLAALIVMSAPFMPGKTGFNVIPETFRFLEHRFSAAYNQYTAASLNAFNLWGVVAMWQPDSTAFGWFTYREWGMILFGIAALVIGCVLIWRERAKNGSASRDNERERLIVFQAVGALLFALFFFVTRAHERHLLPAIVFLTFFVWRSKKNLLAYGALSFLYFLNLFYAYVKLMTLKGFSFPQPVIAFADRLGGSVWVPAVVAFGAFAWFLWVYIREARLSSRAPVL